MVGIREAYLEASSSVVTLLRDPAVAEAWDRSSVLPEFSVQGLAGHLGGQILHVSRLLAADDLALSADLPTPEFPPHIFEPVLDILSRLAVARHGQLAVLRALSRAERAPATIAGV